MKKQLVSILCAAALICSAGAANVTDFSDVRPSDWYHDAVNYVCENGLMNGTSDTAFSPNATTSRSMIVTILYRLAGSPDLPESNWGYPYADVDASAYYSTPVYWARMNDLVTGYSDTQFGPDDAITREQMAAILYRYAQYKGYDVSIGEDTNILSYVDVDQVSDWAMEAFQWACGTGVIEGDENSALTPKADTTRAQAAAMLMRFIEL